MDGMPMKAVVRLAKEIGSINPINANRHPPRPAKKPITGAPMRYDDAAPARIQPIAIDLFSRGRCPPTMVEHIGGTIAIPRPDKEYDRSIALKFGAKKQPNPEMLKKTSPIISSDLCLNRRLRTPSNKANTTEIM